MNYLSLYQPKNNFYYNELVMKYSEPILSMPSADRIAAINAIELAFKAGALEERRRQMREKNMKPNKKKTSSR